MLKDNRFIKSIPKLNIINTQILLINIYIINT